MGVMLDVLPAKIPDIDAQGFACLRHFLVQTGYFDTACRVARFRHVGIGVLQFFPQSGFAGFALAD